jgi:hypothetical protein
MFQDKQWLQDFETLPPEKQAEVVDFIQFLKSRQVPQGQPQKTQRPFGVLKGEVWMSDDFDAPLEDFAEYM